MQEHLMQAERQTVIIMIMNMERDIHVDTEDVITNKSIGQWSERGKSYDEKNITHRIPEVIPHPTV